MNTSMRAPFLFLITLLLPLWAGAEPGGGLAESLKQALEQQGWKAERAANGDIIYRQPAVTDTKPANAREQGPAEGDRSRQSLPTGGPAESLKQTLEQQGWKAERLDNGDIIYRQPVVTDTKPISAQEPGPVAGDRLRQSLRQSGWKTELAQDGGLILWPQQKPTAAEATPPKSGSEPDLAVPDLSGLGYWRIQKGADGSLLLHPLPGVDSPSKQVDGDRRSDRCEALDLDAASSGMPVDNWDEVRKLAAAWKKKVGLEDAGIGRIRKIGRVYLLGIVDRAPPHRLRHQLAVRASDGCVMLLD